MDYKMQYRESLPPDCPPLTALDITERIVRYRLLKTSAPQQDDFDSYVKDHGGPNPEIPRTPCEQRGVSLWASLEAAQGLMLGTPNRKRRSRTPRWQSIGELTIPAGAGKLNPVEKSGHQTWCPSQAFDPVENCKVIT